VRGWGGWRGAGGKYLEQQQTKKIEPALIKKKITYSSYIRKFRMELLQSHI